MGGAERSLTNLALGLDRQRFEPVVFSLASRPRPERSELVRHLESADTAVRFLGADSIWHFAGAVRNLRRELAAFDPQIVQTFMFHANVVGTVAARRLPHVRIFTGIRVADPARWRARWERRLSRHATKIVCVSRAVADSCHQQFKMPADKLVVVPNGIDTGRFEYVAPSDLRQFGVPDGKRVFLFVGRFHPQKGLDWLFKNLPAIFSSAPHHDLLLVGEGGQQRELESSAFQAGIADRVHFAGWRQDVPALMAAADLVVLPSRWEGMPNVVLEAMASARPVVSTRCEGAVELLGPLADQQTLRFGDDQRLVELISALANQPELAAQLGAQNRQRAAEHFSLPSMVSAYAELYTNARNTW